MKNDGAGPRGKTYYKPSCAFQIWESGTVWLLKLISYPNFKMERDTDAGIPISKLDYQNSGAAT